MFWHGADGLSLMSRFCPAADSASKTFRTGRTAQSAEHAVTPLACLVQPGSVSSCNGYQMLI